jgi:hypothetical protein
MENSTAIAKVNDVEILIIQKEKLVPVKPICQALGIDFKSQYDKIKSDQILSSTMVLSTTVGADEKDREMVCLPFKYAFWWIAKIDSRNVNEDSRERVLEAQNKVYDLLWDSLNAYQEYVEYRNRLIEEQNAIRDAARIDFNTAKDKMMEADREMKRRLAVTFQDYLESKGQLRLDFEKEPDHEQ